jgi:hypothetical protein
MSEYDESNFICDVKKAHIRQILDIGETKVKGSMRTLAEHNEHHDIKLHSNVDCSLQLFLNDNFKAGTGEMKVMATGEKPEDFYEDGTCRKH